MAKEIWSTYSVKDHLDPRSLAADVLLFDRLVFPVPERGQFPDNGYDDPTLPTTWQPNPEEWQRWEQNGWQPDEQQKWLEVLQPVIRKVEWSNSGILLERYNAEVAKLASMSVFDGAFVASRTLLTQGLPAYVEGVASMGPTFRSLDEFAVVAKPSPTSSAPLPGRILTNVLAAEFLVPDTDAKISTNELLRETVEFVVGDKTFREKRSAFNVWQQNYIASGSTDAASVRQALSDMRDLVDDTRKAAKHLKVRKSTKNLFRLAPVALGLTGAAMGGGPMFAVAGAFVSVGSFAVDEWLFKASEAGSPAPAAFIMDVKRSPGWS